MHHADGERTATTASADRPHRTKRDATESVASDIATGRAAGARKGNIMTDTTDTTDTTGTIIVQRGNRTYRVATPTYGDEAKPSVEAQRARAAIVAAERTVRYHRLDTSVEPIVELYGTDPMQHPVGPGTPDRITTDFRLDSIGRMADRDAKAIDRAYVDAHKASIRPVRLRTKRDRTLAGSVSESTIDSADTAERGTLIQTRTVAVRAGDDEDGSSDTIIGRPMHWRDKQIAAATRSARKRDAKRTALDERWHGAEQAQIERNGVLRLATAILATDDTNDVASNDATFDALDPASQATILRTLLA